MFKYSCLHFPTTIFHHPTSHPQLYPPLALSMGPLYMFLANPFPSLHVYFWKIRILSSLLFRSTDTVSNRKRLGKNNNST